MADGYTEADVQRAALDIFAVDCPPDYLPEAVEIAWSMLASHTQELYRRKARISFEALAGAGRLRDDPDGLTPDEMLRHALAQVETLTYVARRNRGHAAGPYPDGLPAALLVALARRGRPSQGSAFNSAIGAEMEPAGVPEEKTR